MRKLLNSISVDTKILLTNLIGGILWFPSIFILVPRAPYQIIGSISLIFAGILLLFECLEKYLVKEDEMFIAHMKSAKAKALDITVGGLIWYCITATFLWLLFGLKFEHDWRALAFAVIGFAKLDTFLFFRLLEKTGRSYF